MEENSNIQIIMKLLLLLKQWDQSQTIFKSVTKMTRATGPQEVYNSALRNTLKKLVKAVNGNRSGIPLLHARTYFV